MLASGPMDRQSLHDTSHEIFAGRRRRRQQPHQARRVRASLRASPCRMPRETDHLRPGLDRRAIWTTVCRPAPIGCAWAIASVNRPAAERLTAWLRQQGVQDVRLLAHGDMPIAIDVAQPEMVGLDRLADAVAANRLRRRRAGHRRRSRQRHHRRSGQRRGAFRGGAILAGHRHVGPGPARIHRPAAAGRGR